MALDLGSAIATLKLDTSDFDTNLDASTNKLSGIGGKITRTVGRGVAIASAALVTGMVAIGKESVEAGKKFDSSMSQVAATLGTTVDQIQNLSDFALEMGANTVFFASEAADALNYMALAGYDAETSMAMLPTVLDLAAAGGIELAKASDMVTDAQSALHLSIPETEALVDQMAKTASKSNTSVEQLGEAILTIGGTANIMAGGTNRLNTVLGILADNGIKGSEAGTHLRNMLLKLSAPSKEGAEAIESLGLEVFDAEGKMRDMQDIILDLGDAMADLTDEERIKYISSMFNARDIAAVNALLGTSEERWNELGDAIVKSKDAAQEMAETQLDNLEGDVILFKSALEGAEITLSKKLTPSIRKFVQFGTKEIGKLDKAFQKGGIEGLSEQFGKSLGDTVNKILNYVPKIANVGVKLASSFITSIVSQLPSLATRITSYMPKLFNKVSTSFQRSFPNFAKTIGETLGRLLANAPKIIEAGVKMMGAIIKGVLSAVPKLVEGLIKGFVDGMDQSERIVSEHVQGIKDEIESIPEAVDLIDEKLADINAKQKEAEHWIDIFDALSNKQGLSKKEQDELNTAVSRLNDLFPGLGLLLDENTGKWSLNTQEIRDNIDALQAKARAEAYQDVAAEMYKEIAALELARDKEKDARDAAWDTYRALEEESGALVDLRGKLQELRDQYTYNEIPMDEFTRRLSELVPDVALEDVSDLDQYLALIDQKIKEMDPNLQDAKKTYEDAAAGVAVYDDKIQDLHNDIDWLYQKGAEETKEAVDDMSESFNSGAGVARAAGAETGRLYVDEITGTIYSSEDKVRNAAKSLVSSALSVFSKGFPSGIDGVLSRAHSRTEASYATGIDYVPRDMEVIVHRGERILTQEENKKYNEGGSIEITNYQNNLGMAEVSSKLDKLIEAFENFEGFDMVVDGKKLVGSIRKEINKQLAEEYAYSS